MWEEKGKSSYEVCMNCNIIIPPLANCASLKIQLLLTLMKKILHWTHQMVMKTEDSLVFSWEGRHIPFVLFLCWTFMLDVYFHFLQFIFQVSLPSWTFIYMFVIYIPSFNSISSSHFLPLVNFPLFTKTLPWHNIFASCDTFTNAMKQRCYGYDELL